NMYGHRAGEDSELAPILFGSHLDTVIQGGRFDGVLGVTGALEVIRALHDARVQTRRPLIMVNWTNEEGVRFQPAMLASGVVAGRFTRAYADARRDPAGRSFGEELERIGYRGNEDARIRRFAAYLELHIEQGPVLEQVGADMGVVEGIQGISWSTCRIRGRAGHAGTTPMAWRRDALVAASECVVVASRLPEQVGGDLVCTVGVLKVSPNAINVIPDAVEFTLDMRAPRALTIEAAQAAFEECLKGIRARGLDAMCEEFWFSEPTAFAPEILDVIERSARARNLRTHRMPSGAGHDAKYAADLGPAAMIFVPCKEGRSHAEDEYISWDAAATGAQVLLDTILALAN
ncbi:MAG: M20 family metallo-hydrolase, partial [Armatimonadota bacterium]